MQVHHDIELLPEFRNAVITIGTFDGVHTGHRQIITQLVEEAKSVHGESVIITFYPHPRMVLTSDAPAILLLNTLNEKIELLAELNVDHLVIVPFTDNFSKLSATDYIESFLVKYFKPNTIIIGYDHRFGNGRNGDYKLLEKYAPKYGFVVKEIPKHILRQIGISSTKIREAISKNSIEMANEFLGYPYYFSGHVIKGKQIGRTIGYPTANIEIDDLLKLIPANGIYAVTVFVKKEFSLEPSIYNGMMSIGVNPTVNGKERTIEVNIFDFESDIYNAAIKVVMKYFLRTEEKFDGLEELKNALKKDKENALQKLS